MNIVVLAGSNRKGATSTRLAAYAANLMQRKGHHVQIIDLFKHPLPFYSADIEGMDTNVQVLQSAFAGTDAIVLATPEYHGSISGVLKNALDYLGQSYFSGKAVLSVCSAGGAVGVSSLQHLQAIIRNLHGINCPEWISIGGSQRMQFEQEYEDYEGSLEMDDRVYKVTETFLHLTQQLKRGEERLLGAAKGD
ncbi:NADPH-dependent FMN reductase [Paenibacillus sp. JX-17]|uniref:NADPH-dependent FMN reductase n=1 Tax=Paenibacillus lacisoli TaxID=3064525 RepID=A0ABT9CHX3_9BACL|nr:NADPH-dependent FMN reductase [Paenibacillus sp. JX-17]MDO7908229.1 NADPH-dependent FMN reductase [Paenibacillus sp. JX-17]